MHDTINGQVIKYKHKNIKPLLHLASKIRTYNIIFGGYVTYVIIAVA